MTENVIVEHKCDTNEIEIREMTANEILWLEQARTIPELTEEEQAKVEAKASAESKLSALGLTPEEIAAFRG